MIIDMGYLSKVFKRIVVLLFSVLLLFLAVKLSIFYMPFLIAFIIASLIEPIIRFVKKHTKLQRKTSAIIVLVTVSVIIIGMIAWGYNCFNIRVFRAITIIKYIYR